MSKIERTCPHCALVFSSEKADSLCPRCVLASTFDEDDGSTEPAFWEEEAKSRKPVPTRTFSHFELLDELGRGGMGVVYRARDLSTERIVALKVLQSQHLTVPDLVQRFRSEVRAVSSLDHAHVLPIHEVGEQDSVPFFSMKLTTGGSLAQRIGSFLTKPREAAQLLTKVARGVQHAHERGILHRDLKPGNILIDAAGEPYVCDFGLAKWLEDDRQLTMTAAVLGTPHYIAPEQAMGSKALTTAVDIYSLGAILYELLTGRPPFVGGTVLETLVASQEKTPERPSIYARNVPPDLETICLKALQTDPGARYPTAAAFADDLDNWLAGRPINARPINAAEQLWRWAKRNPLPALLVVALFGTMVTIAIGSTLAAIRIDKERRRAVVAEAEVTLRLSQSLLAQARSSILTGRSGQRYNALEALKQASAHGSTLDLRNEAVSALTLVDLKLNKISKIKKDPAIPASVDATLSTIAMATATGEIEFRNFESGELIRTIPGTGQPISSLAYGESHYLASRDETGQISVIEIKSGKTILSFIGRKINLPWDSSDLTFSLDEKRFAAVMNDNRLGIWKISHIDLPPTVTEPFDNPTAISFHPSGDQLCIVTNEGRTVVLWSMSEQKTIGVIYPPTPARHAQYSPDGSQIATSCADFNIYLWSVQEPTKYLTVLRGHRQDVTQILFSHKGDILVSTGRDRTIKAWDLLTGWEQVTMTEGGFGCEPLLRLSYDDSTLVASDFNYIAKFSISGSDRPCLMFSSPRTNDWASLTGSITFSSDSNFVAISSFKSIDIKNIKRKKSELTITNEAPIEQNCSFLNIDQQLLVSKRKPGAYSQTSIYNISKKNDQITLDNFHEVNIGNGYIIGGSTYPEAGLVTMTSIDEKKGVVYNFIENKVMASIDSQSEIWEMTLSPNFKWIATSYSRKGPSNVCIWSYPEGKLVCELPTGAASHASFSNDGNWIVTTGTLGARIWHTLSWSPGPNLPVPLSSDGALATYSPDSKYLSVSTAESVYLVDATKYAIITKLDSRIVPSSVYRLKFDSSGRYLATQGADNSLRVWDLLNLRRQLQEIGVAW